MVVQQPTRDHEGSHGGSRRRRDRRDGRRRRPPVAGRPVRARRDGTAMSDQPRSVGHEVHVPDPVWRQDFPLTSAGEEEVTRREFVRFLVLASGGFAAGNVGIALWSSIRSINTGEPTPIVELAAVPEGTAHLFDYATTA